MSNDNIENQKPILPTESTDKHPKETVQGINQPIVSSASDPEEPEVKDRGINQDDLSATIAPSLKGGFQASIPTANEEDAHTIKNPALASTTAQAESPAKARGYQPIGAPSFAVPQFNRSVLSGPIFVDTVNKDQPVDSGGDKTEVNVADRIYGVTKKKPTQSTKEVDPLGKPKKPSNAGVNAVPSKAPEQAQAQSADGKEDVPFGQSMIAIVQAIALMFKRLLARIINAFRGRTVVSPEEYDRLKQEDALREKNASIKKQMDKERIESPNFSQANLMTPNATHFATLAASSLAAITPIAKASNESDIKDVKSNVIDFKAFVSGMAGEKVANSPEVQALIEAEQENANRVFSQLSAELSEGGVDDLQDIIRDSLSKGKNFNLSEYIKFDMKDDLNQLTTVESDNEVIELAHKYSQSRNPDDLEAFNRRLEVLTANSLDNEKAKAEERLREAVDSIIEASDSSLKHHPIERIYAVDMLVEALPDLSRFEGVYDGEDDALLASIGQELVSNHSSDMVIYTASRETVTDLVESSREVALAQANKKPALEPTGFKENQKQKQKGGFTIHPPVSVDYEPEEILRPRG